MTDISKAGFYILRDQQVSRMGYGAMQLAGPHVFGPPKDREGAIAVLRAAVETGVDYIDTSDFYGRHITNQLIREALHPYSDDLIIVTKVGAKRGDDGSWAAAQAPDELKQAVHDNLRNLGLDVLDVVNFRISPIQSEALAAAIAERVGATSRQLALAWLLARAPNVLLIPGRSSVKHLNENLAVAELDLPAEVVAELKAIA